MALNTKHKMKFPLMFSSVNGDLYLVRMYFGHNLFARILARLSQNLLVQNLSFHGLATLQLSSQN